MRTIVFRNEEQLELASVLERFQSGLQEIESFEETEIEQLAEIYAKNQVDKFIISETPDTEVAQGDILIWAKGTEMYKTYYNKVKNLKVTESTVLQEGDSMTGDHRLVTLEGTKYSIKSGDFSLKFKTSWGAEIPYTCKMLNINKPFLIVHREHGNIALPAGKYMICSQIDVTTLARVVD